MTRTVSAPLLAALSASPRKAAECVILESRAGERAAFTTWDKPVSVDLGDGADSCEPGITLSAVTLAAGLEASSFELRGPARGEFTSAKVRGGKWRGAAAWLVRVSPGVAGYAPVLRGRVAECRIEGREFVLEVRGAGDAFNQTIGDVMTPYCRRTFGVAATGCPVVRDPYPCEVTAVTDAFRFVTDLAGVHPSSFFAYGTIAFLTGELAGIAEAELFGFDGETGAVELFAPLPQAPAIGDTLNLFKGCSLLIDSDDPTVPTCSGYGVAEYHRGFADVPGSNQYLKIAAPGSGSA